MFAVTEVGLVRSDDGGATWIGIPAAPPAIHAIAMPASDRLYIATDGGVFRSLNGGVSWQPTARTASTGLVAAPPGDRNAVYAATDAEFGGAPTAVTIGISSTSSHRTRSSAFHAGSRRQSPSTRAIHGGRPRHRRLLPITRACTGRVEAMHRRLARPA